MPNEKPIPQQIPIEKIHDLPGIPIVKLPDKSYGGLVTSMLLDGIKEPVILRQREDGEYQLVSGFRRRKAAELAKPKKRLWHTARSGTQKILRRSPES